MHLDGRPSKRCQSIVSSQRGLIKKNIYLDSNYGAHILQATPTRGCVTMYLGAGVLQKALLPETPALAPQW